MTMNEKEIEHSDCKFYNAGKCEVFAESRTELRTLPKRCCMRIVKPVAECFYYQPIKWYDKERN